MAYNKLSEVNHILKLFNNLIQVRRLTELVGFDIFLDKGIPDRFFGSEHKSLKELDGKSLIDETEGTADELKGKFGGMALMGLC
jgi:hypothetical protein